MTDHGASEEAKELARERLPIGIAPSEFAIVMWRVTQLERAGMRPLYAVGIAVSSEAEWRDAVMLKRSGCPDELVAEIVL